MATIRNQSAILNHHFDATVIRINTDANDDTAAFGWTMPQSDAPFLRLPMSASEGIKVLTRFDESKSFTDTVRQHSVGFPGMDSF